MTVFIISLPIKTMVLFLKRILEKLKEIYEHVAFLVGCVSYNPFSFNFQPLCHVKRLLSKMIS